MMNPELWSDYFETQREELESEIEDLKSTLEV
jgi:hypothetical protein